MLKQWKFNPRTNYFTDAKYKSIFNKLKIENAFNLINKWKIKIIILNLIKKFIKYLKKKYKNTINFIRVLIL